MGAGSGGRGGAAPMDAITRSAALHIPGSWSAAQKLLSVCFPVCRPLCAFLSVPWRSECAYAAAPEAFTKERCNNFE